MGPWSDQVIGPNSEATTIDRSVAKTKKIQHRIHFMMRGIKRELPTGRVMSLEILNLGNSLKKISSTFFLFHYFTFSFGKALHCLATFAKFIGQ